MTRALRYTGWTLITAGVVVLLYVVYTLFFTNFATGAAQAELAEEWQRQARQPVAEPQVAAGAPELPGADDPAEADTPATPLDAGSAVAMLEFVRPGSDVAIVHAEPLFVISGVRMADLTRGPGHYPGTAAPGEEGNFAVAGHRTTYGAPFYHLDQLVEGDEVHVTDRAGQRHIYRVVSSEVVHPSEVGVVDADPLGAGVPLLTLTTCHPRFSAAQRLVVFAELVT